MVKFIIMMLFFLMMLISSMMLMMLFIDRFRLYIISVSSVLMLAGGRVEMMVMGWM